MKGSVRRDVEFRYHDEYAGVICDGVQHLHVIMVEVSLYERCTPTRFSDRIAGEIVVRYLRPGATERLLLELARIYG